MCSSNVYLYLYAHRIVSTSRMYMVCFYLLTRSSILLSNIFYLFYNIFCSIGFSILFQLHSKLLDQSVLFDFFSTIVNCIHRMLLLLWFFNIGQHVSFARCVVIYFWNLIRFHSIPITKDQIAIIQFEFSSNRLKQSGFSTWKPKLFLSSQLYLVFFLCIDIHLLFFKTNLNRSILFNRCTSTFCTGLKCTTAIEAAPSTALELNSIHIERTGKIRRIGYGFSSNLEMTCSCSIYK